MMLRDGLGYAPIRFASAPFNAIYEWLIEEADLLDQGELRLWLGLVCEDVVYRAPVRTTAPRSLERSLRDDIDHFNEDYYSLSKRIERLETDHAWAEDPPSRTRRMVTNVRAFEGSRRDEYVAQSNVLLVRSRGDVRSADLVSAGRRDLLRQTPDGIRLAERLVMFDDAVIRTHNLANLL